MIQGYISLPIEANIFAELVHYLAVSEGRQDPIEIIHQAIANWMEQDSCSLE